MRAGFHVILVFVSVFSFASLYAQESSDADPPIAEAMIPNGPPSQPTQEFQIESGFVILDGVYLPTPYSIEVNGGDVTINGKSMGREWPPSDKAERPSSNSRGGARSGFPGGGRRFGPPGGQGPASINANRNRATWIGRLEKNGLVISQDGQFIVPMPGQALTMLQLLASDRPIQERSEEWPETSFSGIDATALLTEFHPTSEFKDRVVALESPVSGNGDATLFVTPSLMRITTFIGMALTVLAVGTLVSCRKPKGAWSQRSDDVDYVSTAKKCLLLIAVLSIFDLVSTLLAISNGGFFEMNPAASPMANSSLTLGMFKLICTGGALSLLWKMRKFAGVQVASWWLCLTLTVLAVRWVAVQSLFYT